MHVAFAVFPQVPVAVTPTHGNASEREQLRKLVRPGGFYVADRGYASNSLFREFAAAGVVRDVLVRRLGTDKHNPLLERPLRIVHVQDNRAQDNHVQGSEPGHVWVLATNALDLAAELVAVADRYRWQIELFFRWPRSLLDACWVAGTCSATASRG